MANVKREPQAEIVSANPQIAAAARRLDMEVRREAESMRQSVTRLGAMLARMRDERLWQYLDGFRTFETYAQAVLGDMGRGRIYELLSIHGLTQGKHAISVEIVEQMGVKKAAELARLEPVDRTDDLVRAAMKETVPVVRQMVHDKMNESAPLQDRKALLVPFGRQLPVQVIELIEEVEENGVWLEGVRDGDNSLPLRAKLWFAVWTNFRASYQEELEEAVRHRTAAERLAAEQKTSTTSLFEVKQALNRRVPMISPKTTKDKPKTTMKKGF